MRIDLDGVALAYGDRVLFEGLHARIESGRVTAVVGPSGSGKSSLLVAMAGYRRPTAGTIAFVPVDGRPGSPDPRLITWVPQGSNALPARTAVDNAMIGSLSRGARLDVARAAALAALDEVGLAAVAGSRVRELSGGELQRLGFARALAAATPFVFADEPTSSLDAANVGRIAELLRGLRGRSTVVVATHDPVVMNAADSIVDLRIPS